MFTVDSESQLGRRRIPNEEICEAAAKNSDMMVAFASIDPHKGKMGAREARRAMTAGAASITEDQVRALLGQLLDAVAKAAEDSELRGQARMALREVLDRVEIDAAQTPPVLSLHCAVQTGDMVASPRGFEPL